MAHDTNELLANPVYAHFNNLLQRLGQVRATAKNIGDKVSKARADFEAEIKPLIGLKESLSAEEMALDKSVREQALEHFKANGELPHELLGVRRYEIVQPQKEATELVSWLIANRPDLLAVDTASFERAAKNGELPPDVAVIVKDPRITIAMDLRMKALEGYANTD